MAGPLSQEEINAVNAINTYRAANGAGPLQVSTGLRQVATWMANDMATKDYLSHTDSLGRSPFDRMNVLGYNYSTAEGENIASGYPSGQQTFEQWRDMCDADASGACTYAHRKIMSDPAFTVIGISRAYNPNAKWKYYWAADFGGYTDATEPLPSTAQPVPMAPQPVPMAPQPVPMASQVMSTPQSFPQPMPQPVPTQPVRSRTRPGYTPSLDPANTGPLVGNASAFPPVTTIPQAPIQPLQSSRVSQQARPPVPGALTLPTATQVRPRLRPITQPTDLYEGPEILTDGLIPIQRLDERGGPVEAGPSGAGGTSKDGTTSGSFPWSWLFVVILVIIVALLIFWISRNKITLR